MAKTQELVAASDLFGKAIQANIDALAEATKVMQENAELIQKQTAKMKSATNSSTTS